MAVLFDLSKKSIKADDAPSLTTKSGQFHLFDLFQDPDTQASEANNIVYHITPLNDMMQQYSNTNFIVQVN